MAEETTKENVLTEITLRALLEAGVHFGHQTQRWNPKMKKFIFMEKNGIYILDLQKTLVMLEKARKLVRDTVSRGGYVLFVGTKKQAKGIIEQSAADCGQHYVTERWLGGMLTNFSTIRRSIGRLQELERVMNETSFDLIGKKERLRLDKERERLLKVFVGIKNMDQLPAVIFVVDTVKEKIAVSEAHKLGIPVVGVVDTNSDPSFISHPIPANDDAIRSIQILTEAMAESVKEGASRSRANEARIEKAQVEALLDREEPSHRGGARATVPEETPAVAKE